MISGRIVGLPLHPPFFFFLSTPYAHVPPHSTIHTSKIYVPSSGGGNPVFSFFSPFLCDYLKPNPPLLFMIVSAHSFSPNPEFLVLPLFLLFFSFLCPNRRKHKLLIHVPCALSTFIFFFFSPATLFSEEGSLGDISFFSLPYAGPGGRDGGLK